MEPNELKAWRKREGLTQQQAAERLDVGVRTYKRHELGEAISELVNAALASQGQEAPAASPAPARRTVPASLKRMGISTGAEFLEPVEPETPLPVDDFGLDVTGLVPWAKPAGVVERDWSASPLSPGWQRCGHRVVHGSIPQPIPFHRRGYHGPADHQPDEVMGSDGQLYDYRTGKPVLGRLPPTPPGFTGSRLIEKTYKRR